MSTPKPRLLFLITEDWFFWSHFLARARAARNAGYEVVVACRVDRHGKSIRNEGFRLIPLSINRRSRNPIKEILTLIQIVRLYSNEKPDLVHQIAIKPILYGSIAARFNGISAVINSVTGLGYAFIGTGSTAYILKGLASAAYRLAIGRGRVVVENKDDFNFLTQTGIVRTNQCLIVRGSGVDLSEYMVSPEPMGTPVVMMASRMLWDKGVREFVEAARQLSLRTTPSRFILVGDVDPGNPASIPKAQLEIWKNEGIVEWWGRREDMPQILSQANIVCLPSYREGLPKVLVEAASCGRPIVATDAPGCRDVAIDGHNALLVPVRDAAALANAISRLIDDSNLRKRLGTAGRKMAQEEFSDHSIAERFLGLYKELLEHG